MYLLNKKQYEFDQLNKHIQKKVLNSLRSINVDNNWYEFVYDQIYFASDIIGIHIDKIYFQLFSQGEGACFEGFYSYEKNSVSKIKKEFPKDKKLINITKMLYKIQHDNFYNLYSYIKHLNTNYYHKYAVTIETYHYKNEDYYYYNNHPITKPLRDFMQWMYELLQDTYIGLTSDEAIIETILSNNYKFNSIGQIIV